MQEEKEDQFKAFASSPETMGCINEFANSIFYPPSLPLPCLFFFLKLCYSYVQNTVIERCNELPYIHSNLLLVYLWVLQRLEN